jgi:hypothetical protein
MKEDKFIRNRYNWQEPTFKRVVSLRRLEGKKKGFWRFIYSLFF